MSWLSNIKTFLSKPDEVHAFGIGFILTYLGLHHSPLVPYAGREVLTPLAFGIGFVVLGMKPTAVRGFCNKVFLPKDINIPEDVRNEWQYYWGGIFLTYASTQLYKVVVTLL